MDLRAALLALSLTSWQRAPRAMKNSWQPPVGSPYLLLRYVGQVDPAKGNLRPEGVVAMLREVRNCGKIWLERPQLAAPPLR